MASGEMSEAEYLAFNLAWMQAFLPFLVDGGILATFIDWRGYPVVHAAATRAALMPLNLVVWNKTNAGMGSLYRSQHELLPLFKKGAAAHVNNIELGRKGRIQRLDLSRRFVARLRRPSRSQDHPTVKPTGLLEDALLDLTNRGNIVILMYGATGYTGRLIAKAARDRGARPILAGRNLDKVKRVAEPLGLSARAFDLGDPVRIDAAIKDVSVVLCAAGPFSATSRPVANACLRNRVHYLDITGEIDVLEALAARDAEAKARGVMLLPGVGFDVAPSDCLAAHLKRRLPDANDLKLYLSLGANMSRGTAKTMIEAIAAGTRMRRKGRIVSRDRAEVGSCDFGEGEKLTVQVSWGDVATAFHSTGIPNIDVHFEASPAIRAFARTPWFVKSFLGLHPMQSLLKSQVDRLTEGPSEADRRAGQAVLVGHARNDKGQAVRSRMRTPEGVVTPFRTCDRSGGSISECYAENQLRRLPLPAGDHTPGDLVVFSVHAQLSRC
jgi:short subunit dehydrogenase-like uncharacterized protein